MTMNNTIMYSEIFESPTVLKACEEANRGVLQALAQDIRARGVNNIVITARGSSDHVAFFAKYLFEIYCGLPVSFSAPSVATIYGAKVNYQHSFVLAVSQSGAGQDVLEVLKAAAAQGAVTAAITNTPDSPIAKACGYHLYCNAGAEKSVAATKTFLCQLYLAAGIAAQLSGSGELAGEVAQIPRAVEYALDFAGAIREKAGTYRFMNECFVLARGIYYPIALEAGLKIQETCYIRARAYAISDFYHGPLAMADSAVPVILIALEDRTAADANDMLGRLKDAGVHVLALTNQDEITHKADNAIVLDQWVTGVSGCFAAAVVAQLFACAMAVQKGNNPDAPRGLKKVTITR